MKTGTRYAVVSILFICLSFPGRSQVTTSDTLLVSQLLMQMEQMQVKDSGDFYRGSFPTYRYFAGIPHNTRPDNGIFYTGLIGFTLRKYLPEFTQAQKIIAEQIIQKAEEAYPYFKNKDGKPIYFFWPTGKQIMPHSLFAKNLSFLLSTAEDADDTVMILMSMLQQNDSINRLAKSWIDTFANTRIRTIKSTYKKYKKVAAYNTYLGRKMHGDFDLCVQANVLYFNYANSFPANRYDSATIDLITSILKSKEHLKDGAFIAPYYVRRPVILYHLARLIGTFEIPQLSGFKPMLIDQLKEALENCTIPMDSVILQTSLLRLGGSTPALLNIPADKNDTYYDRRFVFYQARAGSQMAMPFKRVFLNSGFLNFYFYCPAYNKTLLLEYLMERMKKANAP